MVPSRHREAERTCQNLTEGPQLCGSKAFLPQLWPPNRDPHRNILLWEEVVTGIWGAPPCLV